MAEEATRRPARAPANQRVAWAAVAAAMFGVFATWTSDGAIDLDGTEGPNNGWLVLIVAAFALGWTRSLARGSWIGIVGTFGAAVVLGWTAVENWLHSRDVLDAGAGFGLLLVAGASVALGGAAVARAVELTRGRTGEAAGQDDG